MYLVNISSMFIISLKGPPTGLYLYYVFDFYYVLIIIIQCIYDVHINWLLAATLQELQNITGNKSPLLLLLLLYKITQIFTTDL